MEKEIVIKRVSFNLTIDGQKYKVNKPNMRMIRKFTAEQKELEKAENKDEALLDGSIKFLANLGLPEEVVEELDPEMLEEITKLVTGQKKS